MTADRVAVMERRFAFEEDPERFCREWEAESGKLVARIQQARELYPSVFLSRDNLVSIAGYCLEVGVDGHRGDIIIMKAAKTLAAWEGRDRVEASDIDRAAQLALPHRVRRHPLQDMTVDVGTIVRKQTGRL